MKCNRCQGTGFLNTEQIPAGVWERGTNAVVEWLGMQATTSTDAQICDCCGDGYGWHGTLGEHYTEDDPKGPYGPYSYNGGLAECH